MFHMDMDSQEILVYPLMKLPVIVSIVPLSKETTVMFLVWPISYVVVVKVLVDPMGRPGRLRQLKS